MRTLSLLLSFLVYITIGYSQTPEWEKFSERGEYKETIAGIGGASNEAVDVLYTVEKSGRLFDSYPPLFGKIQLGKAEFSATKFIFYSGNKVYTIENSGSLYEVSTKDGTWKQVGRAGDWKATIAGTILNGSLYTAESSGVLYRTNLKTGEWSKIGNPDFINTKFMVAANNRLYTIEKDGTLYEIDPDNGSWNQLGKAGDWAATVNAVVCLGKMYSIESNGAFYETNLKTGTWKLLGKIDFKPEFLMSADWGYLYAVDSAGFLYGLNLKKIKN
jgi:hypothetical protein